MRIQLTYSLASRVPIFLNCVLLIFAGVFAQEYAMESGRLWSLALYVCCLASSACLMTNLDIEICSQRDLSPSPNDALDFEVKSISEDVGLNEQTKRVIRSEDKQKVRAPKAVQQSLDLDGTAALKALDEVTTQWLISDASEEAAKLVRIACLERIKCGDAEFERAERWFEIAAGLRSRECRSLPKAELRRSYVADRVGVSKEQVRQIDQGRYLPLNKLLEEVDPKLL